ncbi:MAG: glycosyltransferase family 2 protein [Sedimentisphaerales bacterium]|nr:glycosyltransferase family 2 protein [Sedimentisphaerales bacterium]
MDVSIIIVNWNTRPILRDCLRSVFEQTSGLEYEVIVVDNASTDGSVKMVKSEFPQAIVIANSDNRGFAAGNNQAIAIAKGRYVLLLNSDTIVLSNAVSKAVVFADAHPNAAAVGCRILNPDGSLQRSCFMFPTLLNMILSSTYLYKLFPRSRFFGRESMTWWDYDTVRAVDVIKGCFMLVRRQAIEQAGVMDQRFFMYCEETEWCFRLKKAGWQIFYTPDAEIIHIHGASTERADGVMYLQQRGSRLLFMRKHGGFPAYVAARILTALFFLARVPYWLGKAIVCRSKRDDCLRRVGLYIRGAFYSLANSERLLVKRR